VRRLIDIATIVEKDAVIRNREVHSGHESFQFHSECRGADRADYGRRSTYAGGVSCRCLLSPWRCRLWTARLCRRGVRSPGLRGSRPSQWIRRGCGPSSRRCRCCQSSSLLETGWRHCRRCCHRVRRRCCRGFGCRAPATGRTVLVLHLSSQDFWFLGRLPEIAKPQKRPAESIGGECYVIANSDSRWNSLPI
jgi:hypothetical protein